MSHLAPVPSIGIAPTLALPPAPPVPVANNYQTPWQGYPQANIPVPAQGFSIGNWNFRNEGKADLIAGIAAGIRAKAAAEAVSTPQHLFF